jgi:hypothetical protein
MLRIWAPAMPRAASARAGADAEAGVGFRDSGEFGDALDVDDALRGDNAVLHEGQQVGASGKDCGVRAEKAERFLESLGTRVFKGLHQLFLPASALSTFMGVTGM